MVLLLTERQYYGCDMTLMNQVASFWGKGLCARPNVSQNEVEMNNLCDVICDEHNAINHASW